jgi:diguanylate cyclase (GGDEF)-like protein
MRAFLLFCCIGIAIVPGAVAAAAPVSGDIETQLKEADGLRSSNPSRFNQLLARVDAEKQRASGDQLEHLAYLKAYRQGFTGRYAEAIRQARILERSSNLNMRFRAGALIVNTYAITGQFEEGLRQLGITLMMLDEIKDPELRQHGLIVAAAIYNQIGQYRLGLQYADRILAEDAPVRTRCFAGQYRLEALQNLDKLPADDSQITDVIGQCVAQHEIVVANFLRTTLARKWGSEGKRQKALSMLESHMAEVQGTHFPRLIGETNALMAKLLFEEGDLPSAEMHAKLVTALGQSIAETQPLVAAYKTLSDIAQRRNDPVTALEYYKGYARADKAYLNVVKARELAYQIVRQESLEKNQQIQLLNRQNNLLQLQQRVDKQKAENSRLLMMLFAIFTLVIAYWGYKTRLLHASLRHMAQTDALTGICNRHHFTAQAERTLALCARTGELVSLIMFDLDHFKAINDNYGHVTGDWVLKQVSKTCAELCRGMDFFGRLGGEEFAILLHGCDLRAATRIAEDCRMGIARIQSLESGHTFRITASFGVSCSTVAGHDLDKLLSQADQMLYRAKREGRNRVKAFAHDLPAEVHEPAPRRDEAPHGSIDAGVPLGTLNA